MSKTKWRAPTKECVICTDSQPVYRNFPDVCPHHESDTCLRCLTRHCVSRLEQFRHWYCNCPQCGADVDTEILQGILPRSIVKEMNIMVKQTVNSSDEAWRWCLASGCGHGSLQKPRKPSEMVKCRKCSAKQCFKHQVPWHEGRASRNDVKLIRLTEDRLYM